tara:strand:- start:6726 stop:7244 length:519 start_codon:yes stop_codon:yes gene_type:complete
MKSYISILIISAASLTLMVGCSFLGIEFGEKQQDVPATPDPVATTEVIKPDTLITSAIAETSVEPNDANIGWVVFKFTPEQTKNSGKSWSVLVKSFKVANVQFNTKISKDETIEVAKYFDAQGHIWKRNKNRFSYFYDGKDRFYTPDFYLPKENLYVEVKGYRTSKDVAKWD